MQDFLTLAQEHTTRHSVPALTPDFAWPNPTMARPAPTEDRSSNEEDGDYIEIDVYGERPVDTLQLPLDMWSPAISWLREPILPPFGPGPTPTDDDWEEPEDPPKDPCKNLRLHMNWNESLLDTKKFELTLVNDRATKKGIRREIKATKKLLRQIRRQYRKCKGDHDTE